VSEEARDVSLPVVWVGAEEAPLVFANQIIGQVGQQGEVVLTFGQLAPPTLVGTPEQMAEQAERISYVPTKTVARLVITRPGLDQLIEVLKQTVDNYEKTQQAREGSEG
jgi:hypothetical protein